MRRSILTCLAALALLSAVAPPAAPAQGVEEGKQASPHDAEVVARVKEARGENRRVIIKFKNTVSLTGRVGELREKGFIFEPDNKDDAAVLKGMDMVAGVPYEDVVAVERPSKMRKFFKGVGIGVKGVGAMFIVMPIYGVQALRGELPGC